MQYESLPEATMTRSPLAVPPSHRAGPLLGLAVALLALTIFGHFTIRTLEATADASNAVATAPGAADTDPALVSHGDGVVLGQPMPNPFTDTMRFAYEISDAPAWVDISVFDEAGRRVRILAHGTQGPGEHEATWDGLADDGAPVPYGTYFMRARVGEERHVSRVMYLHE